MSAPLSAVQVDRLAARNLCRLRKQAGVPADTLSLALSLQRKRICDIEQGRERLPVDILVSAARVLDIRLERFFEDGEVAA